MLLYQIVAHNIHGKKYKSYKNNGLKISAPK